MSLNITRPVAAGLRKKLDLTPDQEAVALYGLQVILYPTRDFLCFCLVGWLLGCLGTTVVVALTTASLRFFAHGAHSKSPVTCALLGAIMVPSLGKIAEIAAPLFTGPGLLLTVALGFIVAITIVWRLAPVDSPAKPIASSEERQKLRSYAIVIVLLVTAGQFVLLLSKTQAFAVVLAMSFGLWWQAFSLTRAGHWFAVLLDNSNWGKEGKANEASNA